MSARAIIENHFEAPESMRDWERRLSREAVAAGRHIPHSWKIEYDEGEDGCMPAGWYLTGLDENGSPIDFPVRHEYGPFVSVAEAEDYKLRMIATF